MGTDFSQYKTDTISRRFEKRIQALDMSDADAYYRHLLENSDELDTLFNTTLIGVTEFFRDEDVFYVFREYLSKIISDKKPGESIRIWSVGCANGEEPYSIAMLLADILKEKVYNYPIQIFATDIKEENLQVARRGRYNIASVSKLDPKFRDQYFVA
ncbi:MAG: hypothetical protein HC880_18960 [Bacteroidia bacterium]|nr:hypothetical protein [Bacteroidia bacterium]